MKKIFVNNILTPQIHNEEPLTIPVQNWGEKDYSGQAIGSKEPIPHCSAGEPLLAPSHNDYGFDKAYNQL